MYTYVDAYIHYITLHYTTIKKKHIYSMYQPTSVPACFAPGVSFDPMEVERSRTSPISLATRRPGPPISASINAAWNAMDGMNRFYFSLSLYIYINKMLF